MKTKEVKNIQNIFVFGNGLVTTGNGKNTFTDSPTITVSKTPIPIKIGTDLMPLQIEETETIVLEFKNMAGFKVFEKMVKNTKKLLKQKQSIIG